MELENLVMSSEEKMIFLLRSLYERYGYRQYKMSKFEPYDYYVQNKNFLVSDNILTFTDTDGRLMALKPDVTLSIIKNIGSRDERVSKVYYNENVYRVSKGTGSFREIMQTGLECIGDTGDECIREVLLLAAKSLACISEDFILSISDIRLVTGLVDSLMLTEPEKQKVFTCISEKNTHELSGIPGTEKLCRLLRAYGSPEDVLPILTQVYGGALPEAAQSLIDAAAFLESAGFGGKIRIDFSLLNDTNYYSGIVFKGFVGSLSASVLSGGQYDNLMRKIGRKSGAIGFAVYLDMLERCPAQSAPKDTRVLNIALPKGRLGEKVYAMFEKAGFACPAIREPGRKLIFENEALSLRYFWVKPSDVAIYVEQGAADIGVCGKDILLEYSPDVYELTDLRTGCCKMAVAGKKDFTDDPQKTLRIATKFSDITKRYYSEKGREIDIIHLNGSIELAPILGLSDVIVDIVETGTTLRENDLAVLADILPISARLIANKSSYQFKHDRIEKLSASLNAQTEEKQ